jgi:hypothetical protein
MSVSEYQKDEKGGACLLLSFFEIPQISPDYSFAFLWPGQNVDYWHPMLDFVLSSKHTTATHVVCGYLPKTWILYSSGSLFLSLSMTAIWNPKYHRQRPCLSALALEIRIASQKVTCLLWGIEMKNKTTHVFCSQAPKSYIIYCVFVLELQNPHPDVACLLVPPSGSKYSLFKSAQIFFDL